MPKSEINEKLHALLLSLNCKIINSVKKGLRDSEVVGWFCKSTSNLRKPYHLKTISKFISDNNIQCYLEDIENSKTRFFIYVN